MKEKKITYTRVYIKSKKDLPKVDGVYFVMEHCKARTASDTDIVIPAHDEITIAGFFPNKPTLDDPRYRPYDYIAGWLQTIRWYLIPDDKNELWSDYHKY